MSLNFGDFLYIYALMRKEDTHEVKKRKEKILSSKRKLVSLQPETFFVNHIRLIPLTVLNI